MDSVKEFNRSVELKIDEQIAQIEMEDALEKAKEEEEIRLGNSDPKQLKKRGKRSEHKREFKRKTVRRSVLSLLPIKIPKTKEFIPPPINPFSPSEQKERLLKAQQFTSEEKYFVPKRDLSNVNSIKVKRVNKRELYANINSSLVDYVKKETLIKLP